MLNMILIWLLVSFSINAQSVYTNTNSSGSVIIEGTSSLHDWEAKAESVEAVFKAVFNDKMMLESISELRFTTDVKSIESGKGIMNGKIYSAFDYKKHPKIVFTLTEIKEIKEDSIFATGVLAMAGKENTIALDVSYQILKDLIIQIKGSEKLLMTDYGMKPPKAMLGSLKTGDEVEIVFDLIFDSNQ
jgi:polyisoprenoid-binding protein YceI